MCLSHSASLQDLGAHMQGLQNVLLQDAVNAGDTADRVGTKFILPSSFVGGPRYMQQLFQDAMATFEAKASHHF